MFDGPLPDYANTQSARVIGGLGTIARIVADGEDIYARPMKLEAALAALDAECEAVAVDLVARARTELEDDDARTQQ